MKRSTGEKSPPDATTSPTDPRPGGGVDDRPISSPTQGEPSPVHAVKEEDRPTVEIQDPTKARDEPAGPGQPAPGEKSAPTGQMIQVGSLIKSRFRLLRSLGSGGFATVYEAEDTKLGGRVAVKLLSSDKSFLSRYIARFDQESQMVRELRHPNTIRIWDVGVSEDGRLYMVMEYLEGKTLAQELQSGRGLSEDRALRIIEQVLKSLTEAHQRGIVHRDLKPENVMLCQTQGESDFVKVLDFGVAKPLTQELSLVKTQTGMVMGTPGYAAPEILMGEPSTPAADVYAVGLLLVEMLTGMPVIPVGSMAQMVASQLALDSRRVSSQFPAGRLQKVIGQALESNPRRRYGNAAAMLTDVQQLLRDRTGRQTERSVSGAEKIAEVAVASGLPQDLADTVEFGVEGEDSLVELPATPERRAEAGASGGRKAVLSGLFDVADTEHLAGVEEGPSPRGFLWLFALAALFILAGAMVVTLKSPSRRPQEDARPEPETVRDARQTAAVMPPQPREEATLVTTLPVLPGPSVESLDWNWLTGLGEETLDPVAVLTDQEQPSEQVSQEQAPSARILIMESALLNQQAIEMLASALSAGRIDPVLAPESSGQLLDLHERLIVQLLELNRCASARRRLDRAWTQVQLLPEGAAQRLALLDGEVAECQMRRSTSAEPWDSRRYLRLVRQGNELYQQASAQPPEAMEQRHSLLEQAASVHLEARELLLSALADPFVPIDRHEEITRNLWWLDTRLVAIECALDRCGAAELQLDEMLGALSAPSMIGDSSEIPSPGLPAGTAVSAELTVVQEGEARLPAGAGFEAGAGTASDLSRVPEAPDAAPQEESTLVTLQTEIALCKDRTFEPEGGFDWAVFYQLVSQSGQLYDQALVLLVPAEPIPSDVPAPTGFQVRLELTSTPGGARVLLDRRLVGVTPLDLTLESTDQTVVLTLQREGYLGRRIRVDMTAGEFRRNIQLEREPPRSPFGTIQRLVDE